MIGPFLHICVNHCNHKIACALHIQIVFTNFEDVVLGVLFFKFQGHLPTAMIFSHTGHIFI